MGFADEFDEIVEDEFDERWRRINQIVNVLVVLSLLYVTWAVFT